MHNTSVYECQIVRLPKIHNEAGNLTAVNNSSDIPFDIQRVYYLYDIPSGAERGGHAHHKLSQILVAASGSFNVVLSDGENKKSVTLNRPDFGLMIVPGIWREINEFSSGAICLVLASEKYDPEDYIREEQLFHEAKRHG